MEYAPMGARLDTFKHAVKASTRGSGFLGTWLQHPVLPPAEQATFDRYYASFRSHFGAYTRAIYDRQIEELEQAVTQHPGARVLDIGCGCGSEILWLARRHGADVHGIDLKEDRLRVAMRRRDLLQDVMDREIRCSITPSNVLEMDAKEPYDVVWTQQTFHHLEPREDIVRKMVELTRPGGRIIIAEVNAWNPLIQLQMLKKRGIKTIKEYTDEAGVTHIYGDERITTPRRLARRFEAHGVETLTVRPFRLFANRPWADRFLRLERALPGPLPVFTNYNYVGRVPSRPQPA